MDRRKEGIEWIYYGKLEIHNQGIEYSIFPGQPVRESNRSIIKWNDTPQGGYLKFNESDRTISGVLLQGWDEDKILRAIPWE
jgi:hypothetical protein